MIETKLIKVDVFTPDVPQEAFAEIAAFLESYLRERATYHQLSGIDVEVWPTISPPDMRQSSSLRLYYPNAEREAQVRDPENWWTFMAQIVHDGEWVNVPSIPTGASTSTQGLDSITSPFAWTGAALCKWHDLRGGKCLMQLQDIGSTGEMGFVSDEPVRGIAD